MIELNSLSYAADNRLILDRISLAFPAGSFTALLGPNGSGKTTLLKLTAGLLKAASGSILLHGRPLNDYAPKERARHIAYLPQSRPVPELKGRILVEHGRFPYLGFAKTLSPADEAAVVQAVQLTDSAELVNKPLGEMSGGERQRIYLAAALAQDAEILLLDEPTTYLDARFQLELMELIASLHREGRTVVMVAHDLAQAFTYAERISVLEQGRLRCCASPGALSGSPLLRQVFGYTLCPAPLPGAVYAYQLVK